MELGKLKAARVSALRCVQVALMFGMPVACYFSNQPCQLGQVALRFGRPPATKPENGRQLRSLLEVLVAEMQALAQRSGFSPADRPPTLPQLKNAAALHIETEVSETIKTYASHVVAVLRPL